MSSGGALAVVAVEIGSDEAAAPFAGAASALKLPSDERGWCGADFPVYPAADPAVFAPTGRVENNRFIPFVRPQAKRGVPEGSLDAYLARLFVEEAGDPKLIALRIQSDVASEDRRMALRLVENLTLGL